MKWMRVQNEARGYQRHKLLYGCNTEEQWCDARESRYGTSSRSPHQDLLTLNQRFRFVHFHFRHHSKTAHFEIHFKNCLNRVNESGPT